MRRLLLLAALAACGRPAPPPVEEQASRDVPADVQPLADELFELVDRAAEYRGSHRGRPATALRELGVDSLTPTLVRELDEAVPLGFTVRLRRGGDDVSACSGGEEILEQASLHEGRFTVRCDTPAGLRTFEVSRSRGPASP
ncbi:MAG TPA: hypothetical protein VFX50_11590 [Gemmatimonadales bacterium]|nr:hypothetical protein [Gemmatimonadales bacterium]